MRLRRPLLCLLPLLCSCSFLQAPTETRTEQGQVRRFARAAARALTGVASPDSKPTPSVPTVPDEPVPNMPSSSLWRIERSSGPRAAHVELHLTAYEGHHVGVLPPTAGKGPRLYLDLEGLSYDGQALLELGGLVRRIRVGQRQGGTRVVLDLKEKAYKRVVHHSEPHRIVVDLATTPGQLSPDADRGTLHRVVLDPGHGGMDPGAIGPTGVREKDVALDIAHRAAPLIARELGVSTLLTRDGDDYVALDERVAKANAFGADLFVSIHCNASESGDSHGVMSFVLDASGDALAERIAARENGASPGADGHVGAAMTHVIDAESAVSSRFFARLLQRATLASLRPYYHRVAAGGVRRAGFYVLAGADMPAVLFESSFISNPVEERRLDSPAYRQRLADGIVNALRAYQGDSALALTR